MEKISDEELIWLRELYKINAPSKRKAIELIDNLLEERKQPKFDLWKYSEGIAKRAIVTYVGIDCLELNTVSLTRDLPKSPIREIAEKAVDEQLAIIGSVATPNERAEMIKVSESAITEAMALKK